MGFHRDYDAGDAIRHMKKNVQMYSLKRWYMRKLPDWKYKYGKLNSGGNSSPVYD
jgi:hypothetical protein